MGGRKVTPAGYVLLWMPDHHLANPMGYVFEHRLVWEQANDRELLPDERVHHIDGIRSNNTPENLVALTNSRHSSLHHKGKQVAPVSDETRRRLSESAKLQWADPDKRPDRYKKQEQN